MTTFVIPPAGTPASAFQASTFADPALPPGILADSINANTGELTSLLDGPHPVDAMVVHIARTRLGSGAVATVGTTYHEIQKVDPTTTPTDIKFRTEQAYDLLVKRGDIRIKSIVASADGDTGDVYMTYVNLRTGDERLEKVA